MSIYQIDEHIIVAYIYYTYSIYCLEYFYNQVTTLYNWRFSIPLEGFLHITPFVFRSRKYTLQSYESEITNIHFENSDIT